jgi:SAM-dependent methyltransferase
VVQGLIASRPRIAYDVVVKGAAIDVLPLGAYGSSQREYRRQDEVANAEQAAAWNGHEGEQWTKYADRYDRAASRHWQRFLDADLISARDAVLDVGCGTGKSTRDAARIATKGSVLGLDLSAVMLDHAREQNEADGLSNVTYVQGDAQVYPFADKSFDIAMSSFGVMFFDDPVGAFTNIGNGIRPGGRLAVLVWRELTCNEWLMALREALAVGRQLPMPPPDAPTPFALADPERVRRSWARRATTRSGSSPSTSRSSSDPTPMTRSRSSATSASSKA